MANVGALMTLVTMLKASPSMVGVSVAFGEEEKRAQEYALPMVVVEPVGGPWSQSGYYEDADVNLDAIWMTTETVNLTLWANANMDADPPPTAVQHANAVENLRANVVRAFQSQAPNGLMFRPISGQWSAFDDQVNRFGRGYVLTVQVDIACPSALPVDVTLETIVIIPSIDG